MLSSGALFYAPVDKDKIWEIYLAAFKEEDRQSNNCNCCKSFLRQYAGIVGIKDNKVLTLWDFEVEDPEYIDAVKAIHKYVSGLPIDTIFLHPFAKLGTDKNPDSVRGVIWQHFYLELPSAYVNKDAGPVQGTARDNKSVLKRSLEEITDDAVDTVLELINQGSLYRGNEFKNMVEEFRKIRVRYKKIKNNREKEAFCWIESKNASGAVTRIRNSSIGTLLNDLSEGRELDAAVTAFERVVAPTNYRRPTSLVTPRMVESAKKRLEELGLIDSLNRKMLSGKDLSIANVLYIDRPQLKELDVFEELKKATPINPKSLSKVEEVSIDNFVDKVLPTAKSISVLVENGHMNNFVSLIGPKNENPGKLLKWSNDVSWSYSGGVADSMIKERVKAAGGNVEGKLRISLAWSNPDDLDLHLYGPDGEHVFFGNKRQRSRSGATLDTDANGGDGHVENPVENIYWTTDPVIGGEYKIVVNQYNQRSKDNQGYTVEVDYDGAIHHFSGPTNGMTGHNHKIATFTYTKKGGFEISGGETRSTKYNSKEKWGIKTGVFTKIKAITTSPNFWVDKPVGHKHFFFILDGCKTDEAPKPFLNEMLCQALDKERKTMEALNSKFIVEKVEDELSGIGFSETVRAELIVRVEGSFQRVLKIKF